VVLGVLLFMRTQAPNTPLLETVKPTKSTFEIEKENARLAKEEIARHMHVRQKEVETVRGPRKKDIRTEVRGACGSPAHKPKGGPTMAPRKQAVNKKVLTKVQDPLDVLRDIDFTRPEVKRILKTKGLRVSKLPENADSKYKGRLAYREFVGNLVAELGGGHFDPATMTTRLIAEIRGHSGKGPDIKFRVKPFHKKYGQEKRMTVQKWNRADARAYKVPDHEVGDEVFSVYYGNQKDLDEANFRGRAIRRGTVTVVYVNGLWCKVAFTDSDEQSLEWRHELYDSVETIRGLLPENKSLKLVETES